MLTKKIAIGLAALLSVLALSGCHQRAEPVSGMEKQMSCKDLQEEIIKTEKLKKKISSNRGICGRNALGLLFWPSIVINEVTGEGAEQDATDRLVELRNIYAAKQCTKENCADTLKG